MQDLIFKKDFEITLNMEAAESYAKALQGDYSKPLLGEVDIIVLSQPRLSLKNTLGKMSFELCNRCCKFYNISVNYSFIKAEIETGRAAK